MEKPKDKVIEDLKIVKEKTDNNELKSAIEEKLKYINKPIMK